MRCLGFSGDKEESRESHLKTTKPQNMRGEGSGPRCRYSKPWKNKEKNTKCGVPCYDAACDI